MSDDWPRVSCARGQDPASETGSGTQELVARTLSAVWACEGRALRLSVYFCGDAEMRELHEQWLGDASSTDVLSFPLEDSVAASDESAEGELIVCVEYARTCASQYGNTLHAELALYVVHGALHLLGYDDRDDRSRVDMIGAEQRVLERLHLDVRGRHDTRDV